MTKVPSLDGLMDAPFCFPPFERRVDDKRRIALPAFLLEALKQLNKQNPCDSIHPHAFHTLYKEETLYCVPPIFIDAVYGVSPPTCLEDFRDPRRLLRYSAPLIHPDNQHRLLLPQHAPTSERALIYASGKLFIISPKELF